MKNFAVLLFAFFMTGIPGKTWAKDWRAKTEDAAYIHRALKEVTDVIIYDIYSPPVASRTYAYITIAAYETVIHGNKGYRSLAGQLHELTPSPDPDPQKQYSYTLAAVHAILTLGKAFVISEGRIAAFQAQLMNEFKDDGIPQDVYNNSIQYGQQVADHILAWAAKDHYKETRSLALYAVAADEGSWKPTPPAYMKAVEPHWNQIRTFIIDSAQEFKPLPALAFSKSDTSVFYANAKAVYTTGLQLTDAQKAIAYFWDCNPFKINVRGHVMFATKKISPGGHWINITRLACEQTHANVVKTLEAYAYISIVLADAFISCWDEKYRSNVIRPETYINQYIDESWTPLLQTPPFPEYTSGHSVVSSAASVILTNLFGDHFEFTDSTEREFGLLPRHFTSFKQAAREAAISRFYGGIHYMPSILNGFAEGDKIGRYVWEALSLKERF